MTASIMRTAATVAAMSCIRRIRAPLRTQIVAAAIEGIRFGHRQACRLADEVLVGNGRQHRQAENQQSRARRRVSLGVVFLLRSWPGSITIRLSGTP